MDMLHKLKTKKISKIKSVLLVILVIAANFNTNKLSTMEFLASPPPLSRVGRNGSAHGISPASANPDFTSPCAFISRDSELPAPKPSLRRATLKSDVRNDSENTGGLGAKRKRFGSIDRAYMDDGSGGAGAEPADSAVSTDLGSAGGDGSGAVEEEPFSPARKPRIAPDEKETPATEVLRQVEALSRSVIGGGELSKNKAKQLKREVEKLHLMAAVNPDQYAGFGSSAQRRRTAVAAVVDAAYGSPQKRDATGIVLPTITPGRIDDHHALLSVQSQRADLMGHVLEKESSLVDIDGAMLDNPVLALHVDWQYGSMPFNEHVISRHEAMGGVGSVMAEAASGVKIIDRMDGKPAASVGMTAADLGKFAESELIGRSENTVFNKKAKSAIKYCLYRAADRLYGAIVPAEGDGMVVHSIYPILSSELPFYPAANSKSKVAYRGADGFVYAPTGAEVAQAIKELNSRRRGIRTHLYTSVNGAWQYHDIAGAMAAKGGPEIDRGVLVAVPNLKLADAR